MITYQPWNQPTDRPTTNIWNLLTFYIFPACPYATPQVSEQDTLATRSDTLNMGLHSELPVGLEEVDIIIAGGEKMQAHNATQVC